MSGDADRALREPPAGFRWHDTAMHGFAIAVPRRFHLIANTVDPVARTWRGCDDEARQRGEGGGPWPEGLWDPEVVGELDDGRAQPFRLFEFDAINGRKQPLTEDRAALMWFEVRQIIPATLESTGLPGYMLLDVRDTRVGRHDALAFEYRWDGPRHGEDGGDHALLAWIPTPWIVFHIYHHCAEDEWAARLPELKVILSTFRVLGR